MGIEKIKNDIFFRLQKKTPHSNAVFWGDHSNHFKLLVQLENYAYNTELAELNALKSNLFLQ
jgi:hypothetical protein